MITFNACRRLVTPGVAGAALALALLVGVAQAAPAGAEQLDPAAPITPAAAAVPTGDAWPNKIEIGARSDVWPGSLEIGA